MSRKRTSEIDAGIGLDDVAGDESVGEEATGQADKAPRRIAGRPRQDRRPICPQHGKQMVAYSTNAMHTFYKCPVDGCSERAKRVRPVGPFKDLYGNGKSAKP